MNLLLKKFFTTSHFKHKKSLWQIYCFTRLNHFSKSGLVFVFKMIQNSNKVSNSLNLKTFLRIFNLLYFLTRHLTTFSGPFPLSRYINTTEPLFAKIQQSNVVWNFVLFIKIEISAFVKISDRTFLFFIKFSKLGRFDRNYHWFGQNRIRWFFISKKIP